MLSKFGMTAIAAVDLIISAEGSGVVIAGSRLVGPLVVAWHSSLLVSLSCGQSLGTTLFHAVISSFSRFLDGLRGRVLWL